MQTIESIAVALEIQDTPATDATALVVQELDAMALSLVGGGAVAVSFL